MTSDEPTVTLYCIGCAKPGIEARVRASDHDQPEPLSLRTGDATCAECGQAVDLVASLDRPNKLRRAAVDALRNHHTS